MAYPNLGFEVIDITCGIGSMVLYYTNQRGAKVSEDMEFDQKGKVNKVIARYSARQPVQLKSSVAALFAAFHL